MVAMQLCEKTDWGGEGKGKSNSRKKRPASKYETRENAKDYPIGDPQANRANRANTSEGPKAATIIASLGIFGN